MEQNNYISEELKSLGSSLGNLSRVYPFEVPEGYFDSLLPFVLEKIREKESTDPKKEIEILSPLLAGMNRQTPFEVPAGYFENPGMPQRKTGKLTSLRPATWLRYVAAVVVIGFVALAGLVMLRKKDVEKIGIGPYTEIVKKEIGKMSEGELVEFLENTNPILVGDEKAGNGNSEEIKKLLEDIPVSELKEFIDETTVFDTETILLN